MAFDEKTAQRLSSFRGKRVSTPGRAAKLGIPRPLKVIRLKCLDCSGGSALEVKECRVQNCALWPYRMGRYPKAAKSEA